VSNHGDDEEDEQDIKRALERQGDVQLGVLMFDFESNSECRITSDSN
jgi:hypothetical protein